VQDTGDCKTKTESGAVQVVLFVCVCVCVCTRTVCVRARVYLRRLCVIQEAQANAKGVQRAELV